jgi:hypothetical protein
MPHSNFCEIGNLAGSFHEFPRLLTLRFLFAYNLRAMSQLYKVSFRAHLVPEGFACVATVVTVADTAQEAIERAARWFTRNQPYYDKGEVFPTSCLDNFEAVMLPHFVCYGMERPLLWEFPHTGSISAK